MPATGHYTTYYGVGGIGFKQRQGLQGPLGQKPEVPLMPTIKAP